MLMSIHNRNDPAYLCICKFNCIPVTWTSVLGLVKSLKCKNCFERDWSADFWKHNLFLKFHWKFSLKVTGSKLKWPSMGQWVMEGSLLMITIYKKIT